MNPDARLALILSFIAGIGLPTLTFCFRIMKKWTKIEMQMEQVVKDMGEIVEAKDRVHAEMIGTMRDDRRTNDSRLRWLEENLWGKGRT